MSDQTELLHCPFCGGAADALYDPAGILFDSSIHCSVCLASGPCPDPGQSHAECWNTRAAPAEDVRAVGEEPVYLYRRKGFDSWATCDRKRFDMLAVHNCFEVDTLYRRVNACLDAVEELNKC